MGVWKHHFTYGSDKKQKKFFVGGKKLNELKKGGLMELQKIKNQIVQLCSMYRSEFGDDLYSGKLILRPVKCSPEECKYCPHGPYWYRAVFNKKKRKFIFVYVGAKLKKSMLRKSELFKWERYKFYEKEVKRIKEEKKFIIKQLKEIEKHGI